METQIITQATATHTATHIHDQKHTEVVFHKDVPIDESPSGWRIQTGQGEEGFEQYDKVKELGKGAYATAYEVVNTKTGEHSAFKVYNVRA